MELPVICLASLAASLLTFFSGFGLGTLLTPVFAIWFPLDLSIALTAVVHFLNNLFKLFLVGRHANRAVILRFGLIAIPAAFLGAWSLVHLTELPPLGSYAWGGREFSIQPVKLIIAGLIVFFTVFELLPRFKNLAIDAKYLPLGGVLSGFLGGLSGHQGALRSAFLIRSGLGKEGFIATGVVIACLIDATRMSLYARHFAAHGLAANWALVAAATVSAFIGALLGSKMLPKLTMGSIQVFVSVGLILFSVALGAGLI